MAFNVLKRMLSISIVVIFFVFCWMNLDSLVRIKDVSVVHLMVVCVFYSLVYFSNAFCSYVVLKRRNCQVSLIDLFTINSYSSVLGYVSFFRAGYYASKGYFYRKLYELPISSTLGVISYISVLAIMSSALVGLIVGAIAVSVYNISIPISYWLVLVLSLLLIFILVIGLFSILAFNILPERVKRWVENLKIVFVGADSRELLVLLLTLTITVFFQAIALRWLFYGYGLYIPFIYFIFIAVFANLSLIISITPSNIGVKEALIILLVAHLDVSLADIFSVLLIDRILQFLLVSLFSLGGYSKLKRTLRMV